MCTTCGCGDGAEAGPDAARLVTLERDLLAANDAEAAAIRRRLAAAGTLALNLVSSPGAGKTTLLCRTIEALAGGTPLAVVEGDQRTERDAERIRAAGAPAVQVTTGKACHLDARMVARALDSMPPPADGLLFVENVGNLVCPAAFDLGEAAKVALFSVTEGEDKPLKYPDIFAAARLVLVCKTDLAGPCSVDPADCAANVRRANPRAEVIALSARTGDGMQAWLNWLAARLAETRRPGAAAE
jgi:hydrogenase nickel incorporation protein HypB